MAASEHFVGRRTWRLDRRCPHATGRPSGEQRRERPSPLLRSRSIIALIHNGGIIENLPRVLGTRSPGLRIHFPQQYRLRVLVNLIEYVRARRTAARCSKPLSRRSKQVIGAYAIAIIERKAAATGSSPRARQPMVKSESARASTSPRIRMRRRSWSIRTTSCTRERRRGGHHRPQPSAEDRDARDNRENRIDIKATRSGEHFGNSKKGAIPTSCSRRSTSSPRPSSIAFAGRVNPDDFDVRLSGVIDNRERFLRARRIIFVACGTSWHASSAST